MVTTATIQRRMDDGWLLARLPPKPISLMSRLAFTLN